MKTTTIDQAARRFHALSDPTRLALIARLGRSERCVCELMDVLDAAQSRLSFHLKVLKEAGLVTDRRDGRWVYYTLTPDVFDACREYLDDLAPRYRTLPVVKEGACCD